MKMNKYIILYGLISITLTATIPFIDPNLRWGLNYIFPESVICDFHSLLTQGCQYGFHALNQRFLIIGVIGTFGGLLLSIIYFIMLIFHISIDFLEQKMVFIIVTIFVLIHAIDILVKGMLRGLAFNSKDDKFSYIPRILVLEGLHWITLFPAIFCIDPELRWGLENHEFSIPSCILDETALVYACTYGYFIVQQHCLTIGIVGVVIGFIMSCIYLTISISKKKDIAVLEQKIFYTIVGLAIFTNLFEMTIKGLFKGYPHRYLPTLFDIDYKPPKPQYQEFIPRLVILGVLETMAVIEIIVLLFFLFSAKKIK